MTAAWDGHEYQQRFDALAAAGRDVHGEATFIRALDPASVLDGGCGTGRVGIELARHGIDVVGVDVDPSMLATARGRAPTVMWVEHDLCTLDLGRRFDVVVLAGNVPLFTPPGTQAALVATMAAHLAPGGVLVAGFSTAWKGREYTAGEHDRHCVTAGLTPVERFSTWDRRPWTEDDDYVVGVARA